MSARPGADRPYPKATEARKPDTPGRARYKPSNHCAGNVGCPPLNLYARVRFLFPFCTRDRGCSAHPAFPAPSDFKARNVLANLGRTAPRECEVMSAKAIECRRATPTIVIARQKRKARLHAK